MMQYESYYMTQYDIVLAGLGHYYHIVNGGKNCCTGRIHLRAVLLRGLPEAAPKKRPHKAKKIQAQPSVVGVKNLTNKRAL